MLTPRQYASLRGVAYTTVMNWLQQGKIPQAVKQETPTGHYWEVPENAPAPASAPGRPPKQKETAEPAPKKSSRKKGAKSNA